LVRSFSLLFVLKIALQIDMKTHTTNYTDTFIQVSEDCPAVAGEVPPLKGGEKTVAGLQYEMVSKNPYRYTSDDVLFQVYASRQELTTSELKPAREQFFSKGQACLRSSPLTKRYGWGVHCDGKGRVAIYSVDSAEYKKLSGDKTLKQVKAMRSKKGE
jgi:hypothetical protein